MPQTKTLIVLANSRKFLGRCVAGIDSATGEWIRPIGSAAHREVSEVDRQYEDGSDPQVLHVVRIPMIRPVPDAYQSENWLIDSNFYWERRGQIGWDDLSALAHAPSPLWLDSGASDTRPGTSDRVRIEFADTLQDSLRLIHVTDLELVVRIPWEKRKLQAQFTFSGNPYAFWVSDPEFERHFLAQGTGSYPVGEAYLTVSLAERHDDGYCYKMVAAVITPERAEGA